MDRSEEAKVIGERIRELRLARGFSQRQLSLPGVSPAFISRLEKGERLPSIRTLRKLADKLAVSAEFLETGEEPVRRRIGAFTTEELVRELGRRLPGMRIIIEIEEAAEM